MRRFDKLKNIQKANILAEQRYFESKGLTNEDIMSDFSQMYTEAFQELDIRINGVLIEGKDMLNEFGIAAIGGLILASGKFLDLIGTLARKFQNWAVKKGYLKGDKWEKTKFEEWGEGINKWFLAYLFKPLAEILLAPIAAIVTIFGGDGEAVMGYADELANTLFAGAVIILFGVNLWNIIKDFAHLNTLTGIVEGLSQSTKLYEIILLCIAFFIHKKIGKSITQTAHALGNCLEGDGQYGKLMSNLKMLKDKGRWNNIKTCIIQQSGHH